MASSLGQLTDLFAKSLTYDEAVRKAAEKQIVEASSQQGFSLALIQLIAQLTADDQKPVRLAAAIRLKNICRQDWHSDVSKMGDRCKREGEMEE